MAEEGEDGPKYVFITENQETKKTIYTKQIAIETPARKNEFTKRKKWLLENIEDDSLLEACYAAAKGILFSAAVEYSRVTNKSKNSLFKNRGFDKDYLRPQIENFLALEK